MVLLCLGMYFSAFLIFRSRTDLNMWRVSNPNVWLGCMPAVSGVIYAVHYLPSGQALTLLAVRP